MLYDLLICSMLRVEHYVQVWFTTLRRRPLRPNVIDEIKALQMIRACSIARSYIVINETP